MSKIKLEELDVDFIGGQGEGFSLTKSDEIAISEYIRAYKLKHAKKEVAKKGAESSNGKKKEAV